MAKKLVTKEDLSVKEQEPDRPVVKARYTNINMRMKTARR